MKIGNNILGQMFISNTGLNANLDNKDEEDDNNPKNEIKEREKEFD